MIKLVLVNCELVMEVNMRAEQSIVGNEERGKGRLQGGGIYSAHKRQATEDGVKYVPHAKEKKLTRRRWQRSNQLRREQGALPHVN